MIAKKDLPELAKQDLAYILDKPGELIYSSHETLKKGDLYVLGLNPGLIERNYNADRLENHIDKMLTKTHNSYLDEDWSTDNKKFAVGEAPLQRRMKYLLWTLGYDPKEVCASNMIFASSKDADSVNYGLAGYCWRFHERILDLVQPKMILCFGVSSVSAYSFLQALTGSPQEPDTMASGHGKWKCESFTSDFNGRPTTVIGVPHLSYYDITTKSKVIDWIKGKLS